jgi:beta-glucanase (GH16 family)
MRITRAVFGCGLVLAPPAARAFDPGNPAASGYTLSLSDDFASVPGTTWENNWWYEVAGETPCERAFLPGTVGSSANGLDLHIQSLENFAACQSPLVLYSFAHLDSYGRFAQVLGYFEARIQSSAVGGTLTAFWLLPENGHWPPELDIEEIRGDVPATAYVTNHVGANNRQTQFIFTSPRSLGDAFHTYSALLTATTITWFIDGQLKGQTRRGAGELARLFPIFSLYTGTCGDGWAGCPSATTGWSADAYVRWIRIWKAPAG